ncbi:ATP-binding protein [Flavivirga aquimarina]|uniref:histidine kinase n=1 Tax=Flavivirga aquimarina TaxID=2027862 RepID=A0ABT8WAR4_9FLAO|nr:tetratricopeptide repeat-containing sensor histidine kinase [Flavivirga aquimarina]MDO5970162.1 ATP-binding protein [Flavivirga aquimarina]
MNKYCLFIAYLLLTLNINAQNDSFDVMLDSIQELRKLSKKKSLNLDDRLKYAERSSELSNEIGIDSLILLSNEKVAYLYSLKKDYEYSIKLYRKNLKLAHKLNDSLSYAYAAAGIAYGYNFYGVHIDSSLFYFKKSIKISEKINYAKLTLISLRNIALLQKDKRDYLGSDISTFKTINLLKTLPKSDENLDNLSDCYNNLGLNAKYLKLYDKAIEYHQKSLLINNELSDRYESENVNDLNKFGNYLYAKINLAEAYKEKGNYKKALSIYERLLENKDLLKKDPLSYVAVINNKAYNLFLSKNSNTKYIKSLFNKAYKISDSLNALYEITAGGNDMAEFYHAINKKDSALMLSKRSYAIGKQIKNYYEVSRALLMLSKLEEGETGKQYLYEHIKLNDSLLDIERASRNKFARIQYETDNYKDETKRLATQNILIVSIGLIIILVSALIFSIKVQITKNELLRFESEQQKANEEIYTLMLRQQSKIEEGRLIERHRISEELHDGILNRLLGSRLGLEFLTMDNHNKEKYRFYIDEIQTIEKEIRNLSHELKNTKLDADKDFVAVLKDYISNQSNLHAFQYNLHLKGTIAWDDINDYIKVNLYRIIQEAIQNVIKHAKAKTITINFYLKSNNLYVDIADDGIGFGPNLKRNGIGLLNIESRVSKLKGKLTIISKIKIGTILVIQVPLFKSL